jgi:trehalose 6-phosphate phosphatase
VALPERLIPLAARPHQAAVLVDFDGSISEIVDDPASARVIPTARDALVALADRMARVGVVSGRPVDVLARTIAAPEVMLVGQYGLERLVDGRVVADPRVEPFLPAIAAAAADVERELPGLFVERKAGIAVTVHWRTSPAREAEAVAAVDRIARRQGLTVYATRKARELRPPITVDKGTAVETLLEGVAVASFAGDDRGDLPAFAALERAVADGRLEHGARIAVGSNESPPELLAEADVVVDGPAGLVTLLEELAVAVTAAPG